MKNWKLILLIFVSLNSPVKMIAQAPSNIVVTPLTTTLAKLNKFEANISFTGAYTNPYDYNDVAVQAIFTAPGGRKDTVDGFFMQDYTLNTTDGSLTAAGQPGFKIRYAPNLAGNWQYIISVTNTAGTANSAVQSFQCTDSSAKGFIRKNASNYLGFDDNEQYIPVGQNLAWQDNNIYLEYKSWLQKLSANKANLIRVWQAVWGLGIEWKNGYNGYSGLKKYKQTSAFYTDWLLDDCKASGIYVMLCINHHGMVSSTVDPNWSDSPYNAANGGPCNNTWDFFSNQTAKSLHKNRLRYIVARWGYSQSIMSWELFNEVDWTDNFATYKDAVKDWHIEMANYLKTIDVYKHLVTTSYANGSYDPNTWGNTAIDFTQTHNYINSPNIESALAAACSDYVSQYNKPTMAGEFGLDPSVSSLPAIDPNGIYIHNSIWATAFSGAMGAGMSWWWDTYIDPQNLYYHYKPLSNFTATLTLKDDKYKKTGATITGGGAADLSLTPGIGFASAGASSFTIDASGNVIPSASQLSLYLFGSVYNTQYRNPPTFTVTYPIAGQFKVITGSSTGTSPNVTIYLDGIMALSQNAAVNSTYLINVPAGAHTIKADNTGTDWISLSNYTFTNIGSPLNTYILKSADSTKVAGWVHNKKYNWQYVKDNGTPAPVNGATATIPAMKNGSYMVQFTDCITGSAIGTASATASGNNLVITLPIIAWDVAITAVIGGVTPVTTAPVVSPFKIYPNPAGPGMLYIIYNLAGTSQVNIDLYDMKGSIVASIFSGMRPAGNQSLSWNPGAANISSGIYLMKSTIGKNVFMNKIMIYK